MFLSFSYWSVKGCEEQNTERRLGKHGLSSPRERIRVHGRSEGPQSCVAVYCRLSPVFLTHQAWFLVPSPQHPLTMVMLFSGDLYSLLNFLSFARWLFIGLAVGGLIYLRYKRPDMHRPFKVTSAILMRLHKSLASSPALPLS